MKKYTKKQLIFEIQTFVNINNRIPKVKELKQRLETFRRYFGSYQNAILAAGFVHPKALPLPKVPLM